MNSHPSFTSGLTQLEILGFDRVGFVEEVTRFTTDYGRIVSVKFEADGVRSVGFLKVQMEKAERLESLLTHLKSITGLVKVKSVVNH